LSAGFCPKTLAFARKNDIFARLKGCSLPNCTRFVRLCSQTLNDRIRTVMRC